MRRGAAVGLMWLATGKPWLRLSDWVEDINNADRSGPSRRTDFSCSTGNSTNNSEAKIWQHTLHAKALKNIDLLDKNYILENDLLDTQEQMAALLAQNLLLQEQLSGARLGGAMPGTHHGDGMENDAPAAICGGGCEEEAGSLGNRPLPLLGNGQGNHRGLA